MVSMKAYDVEGVSFSLPVKTLHNVIMQLTSSGKLVRPTLGISCFEINPVTKKAIRQERKEVPSTEAGLYVVAIEEGSIASKNGVLPGDVILEVDGVKVTSHHDLREAFSTSKRSLNVKVARLDPHKKTFTTEIPVKVN